MLRLSTMLVCLMVLAVVTSQSQAASLQAAKEPKKCCFPEQFTINKGSTIGTVIEGQGPLALYETQDTAFDYKNNRTGAHISAIYYNGLPTQNYRTVTDFTQETVWVIDSAKKQCVKESVTDFPYRCVPENATFAGTVYFADKALYADSWYFYIKDYIQTTGSYSLAVVGDTCIPFSDTFVGTSTAGGINQQVVSTSGYTNYVKGISDPDRYFTLPDYCPGKLTKRN